MGSLTSLTKWIPEDDLLLKNAVEAGASLEALARGAVPFSKRFTIHELQDRWRSLLYDIETSMEASVKILAIELEQATANLSKSYENESGSKQKKGETVRGLYYAMRKRVHVEPHEVGGFGSLGEPVKDENMHDGDNFDDVGVCPFGNDYGHQVGYGDGTSGVDSCMFDYPEHNMSSAPLDGTQCDTGNHMYDNFQNNDFPHILGEDLLVATPSNDLGTNSPFQNGLDFNPNDLGYASQQPEMHSWAVDIENDHEKMDASAEVKLDDNNDANHDDGMGDTGLIDPTMQDNDLTGFSDADMAALFSFDVNEEDNKDKSGLESKCNVLASTSESETCPETTYNIDTDIGVPDEGPNAFCEQINLSSVFSIDISSTSSSQTTKNVIEQEFTECTFNTEDTEIPNNDHIIFSAKVPYSVSSSSKLKRVKRDFVSSLGNKNDFVGDLNKGKEKLGNMHHTVPNFNANSLEIEPSTIIGEPVDAFKEENQENLDDLVSYLETTLDKNDDSKINPLHAIETCPEEANMKIMPQPEMISAEVMPTSDQEGKFSESEDGVPYTSEVEDLILSMDLGQYGEEPCPLAKEGSRCQQTDTKKMIRWEQGLHSHINRSIASNGAYAVFCGRRLKYFIKSPQVTIGRETEDNKVDIDLEREGRANRISRQQAIIKMDEEGEFSIVNLGRSSIFINGKEVHSKRCTKLPTQSLIKMHGMIFAFDVNESAVRRYKISRRHQPIKKEQSACKFEWRPDQNP